jgi:hypothetical protein
LIHREEYGLEYILKELSKNPDVDVSALRLAYKQFLRVFGEQDETDYTMTGLLGRFLRPKPDFEKLLSSSKYCVAKI